MRTTRSGVRTCIALSLLLFLMVGKGMAGSTKEPLAASVLIKRFETVFRSDRELLKGTGPYEGLSQHDSDALRVPFVYLNVGLNALSSDAANAILGASKAVFVGAKDFRAPSGLGSVRSQFCFIIVLDPKGFEIGKFFRSGTMKTYGGSSIWEWEANLKEYGEGDPKPSPLYAAEVGTSYVIVSNNIEETKAAIDFLRSPESDSKDPIWTRCKELIKGHDIWGYRRYRHTDVKDREASGMAGVTSGADALVYLVDKSKKSSTLVLLSVPTDTRTAMGLNKETPLPPLRPTNDGPGHWETSFPLSGDGKSSERVFYVMGLFGFGIYA